MKITQPSWRRSSFCQADGCVEIAEVGTRIWVRSSKNPAKVLEFTEDEWRAFHAGMLAASGGFKDSGAL